MDVRRRPPRAEVRAGREVKWICVWDHHTMLLHAYGNGACVAVWSRATGQSWSGIRRHNLDFVHWQV